MLPQKIFKNHKIFEKKSQDLDSKSQVYKIKLLMTFYAKLKSVITSESTVMTFELHRLRKRNYNVFVSNFKLRGKSNDYSKSQNFRL